MSIDTNFERNAFVNCPFDEEFEPILRAILFTVIRFGFRPRIASANTDSGESRLERILELIRSSRYSIHDLSRFQAKQGGEFYRMNMPFELGLDIGCRRFWGPTLAQKKTLVLEEEQYQYQKSLSDLAGCDVEAHSGRYSLAVRKVRDWFAGMDTATTIGATQVLADYEDFQRWHIERQRAIGSPDDDMKDYSTAELLRSMFEWYRSYQNQL